MPYLHNFIDGIIVLLGAMTDKWAVICLPWHPASFGHNFVSGMQSFHLNESHDAMVLQTCHKNSVQGPVA